MIFAVAKENTLEVLLAASKDGQAKFDEFIEKAREDDLTTSVSKPDFMRCMQDREISAFKKPPMIATFENAGDMQVFAERHGVKFVNHGDAVHEQMRMDMMSELEDTRTIREIHGLDENDPWDNRTEEQKEASKQAKKAHKDQKRDDTEGSWGDGGSEEIDPNKIRVGNVEAHVDENGDIVIDRIVATKGDIRIINHIVLKDATEADYYLVLKDAGIDPEEEYRGVQIDENGMTVITHEGGASNKRLTEALKDWDHTHTIENEEPKMEGDPNWVVAQDEMVAIYYRVDVPDQKLETIEPMLVKGGMRPAFAAREVEEAQMCWLAYVREETAEQNRDILLGNSIPCEVVAVDRFGERIIAEDAGAEAKVVDTGAAEQEPPAPWNDRADEFAAMDEKEQRKAIKGSWLLYSIRDYGAPHHRIIHITPLTYFNEHERLWEGELPIEHLFGDLDIKKFGDAPGMYQCKALDTNTLDFMLGNRAKMKDSLLMRGLVNSYPDGDQRKVTV